MSFNKMAGERISKEKMKEMRAIYDQKNLIATKSIYFGRDTFKRLLEVKGSVGIRVYYGMNEKDELHPIFVPVDESGNDIYTESGQSTIEEYGTPCPPVCPK